MALHARARGEADALVDLDFYRKAAADDKHLAETCAAELARYKAGLATSSTHSVPVRTTSSTALSTLVY